MTSLEARRLLELAPVLDYLSKGVFHQTGATFSNEIRANQNLVAPVFAVESFDKVAQTVENVVGNNNPENQSYAPDLTGANISNVMPESSSPDLMDATVSALLSSFDAGYELLDLSPQRDMTSGLHFPKMSEMGRMLPFAINSGAQMQQMPAVPQSGMQEYVDIPDTASEDLCEWNQIFMPLCALPTLQNFLMQYDVLYGSLNKCFYSTYCSTFLPNYKTGKDVQPPQRSDDLGTSLKPLFEFTSKERNEDGGLMTAVLAFERASAAKHDLTCPIQDSWGGYHMKAFPTS
ncbi:hypothetical protein HAX54_047423 [Datura stramonium]|uniref:Uncharacterized protein n=1 Tax=Datura stramonium TaxID=4076 RepID=A0ABS8SSY1_DATST|nr:hypothetical protein [Datura stramonium]